MTSQNNIGKAVPIRKLKKKYRKVPKTAGGVNLNLKDPAPTTIGYDSELRTSKSGTIDTPETSSTRTSDEYISKTGIPSYVPNIYPNFTFPSDFFSDMLDGIDEADKELNEEKYSKMPTSKEITQLNLGELNRITFFLKKMPNTVYLQNNLILHTLAYCVVYCLFNVLFIFCIITKIIFTENFVISN